MKKIWLISAQIFILFVALFSPISTFAETNSETNTTDLSYCRIAGYGTYYGANNNENFQVGILSNQSNQPCYSGAKLTDFTWSISDTTIAEISETGYISTKNDNGFVNISAQHKTTGDTFRTGLHIGDLNDDPETLFGILETKINTYGSGITNLTENIEHILLEETYTEVLKSKANILQAIEEAYIRIGEIEAETGLSDTLMTNLNELFMEKIAIYNFYEDSAYNMLEDIEFFTDTVTDTNIEEKLNNLEFNYESNLANAAEEKYYSGIIPFIDTELTMWYIEYVIFAKQHGIVNGYTTEEGDLTGYFGPADYITVAELLKMAINTAGTEYNPSGFTYDYPAFTTMASHWAFDYYKTAKSHNFTLTQDKDFNPDRYASRGEVIRTFFEAFSVILEEDNCYSSFDDVFSTTAHGCYIEEARNLGIISGDDATNNFRPYEPINRVEVAKIVKKTDELLAVEEVSEE